MWIMTSYGIMSVVILPEQHRLSEHTNWDMQVRSRDRKTLVKMVDRMLARGCDVGPIMETFEMDYEYRVYLDREDFAEYIAHEVASIDYRNFKSTTERRGAGGVALHQLYNSLWYHIARFYDSTIVGGAGPRESRRVGRRAKKAKRPTR